MEINVKSHTLYKIDHMEERTRGVFSVPIEAFPQFIKEFQEFLNESSFSDPNVYKTSFRFHTYDEDNYPIYIEVYRENEKFHFYVKYKITIVKELTEYEVKNLDLQKHIVKTA